MRSTSQTAITVVVTFLVTLGLNLLLRYVSLDKGSVLVAAPIVTQGTMVVAINISNYTENTLDDVLASIPSYVSTKDMVASDPLKISDLADTVGVGEKRRVSISGIDHNRVTQLWIPIRRTEDSDSIKILNAPEKKLRVFHANDVTYPYAPVVLDAVIMAVLYSAFYYGMLTWMNGRYSELRKDFDADVQRIKDFETKYEAHRRELAEVSSASSRIKILLLARISDYAKELQFWRDTVRKVLYQTSHEQSTSEKLINQVTQALGTHTARTGETLDFDVIKAAAGILSTTGSQGSDAAK